MKKLESKLFDTSNVLERIDLEAIYGGANKSDVNYSDSKKDGGGWGVDVNSVIDFIDSSRSLDCPSVSEEMQKVENSGTYIE